MATGVANRALEVDNYAVRGMFARKKSLGLIATVAALGLAAFAGYMNQRVLRTEWCGRTPGAAFVTTAERAADLCRALVPTWKRVAAPALGAGGLGAVAGTAPRSFTDRLRESLPLSAPIAAMVLALGVAWLRRREGYVWLGVLVIGLMLAGTNVAMLALSQTTA